MALKLKSKPLSRENYSLSLRMQLLKNRYRFFFSSKFTWNEIERIRNHFTHVSVI